MYNSVHVGKYVVSIPDPLVSHQDVVFSLDSNFLMDTLKFIGVMPGSTKALIGADLLSAWEAVGLHSFDSLPSVLEISWRSTESAKSQQDDLGLPADEYVRKNESVIRFFASLEHDTKVKLLKTPHKFACVEREYANFESSNLDNLGDDEILHSLHQIIYQEWAAILIMMKYFDRMNFNLSFEYLVSSYWNFREDLIASGIGISLEAEMLSRFVFFGGHLSADTSMPGKKWDRRDIFKRKKWERDGTMQIARNIAFDTQFMKMARKSRLGDFPFSLASNSCLITGDYALTAQAANFQPWMNEDGILVLDYLWPLGNELDQFLNLEERYSLLHAKFSPRNSLDLLAAEDIRCILPDLDRQISSG